MVYDLHKLREEYLVSGPDHDTEFHGFKLKGYNESLEMNGLN